MQVITGKRSNAVRCAGWRLRLTRPTVQGFVGPVSAAPPGDMRGRRMAQRESYAKPCAVSSSRFSRNSGVSLVIIQTPAAHRRAHSTARPGTSSTSAISALWRAWSAAQAMSCRPIPFPAGQIDRELHNKQRRRVRFSENKPHGTVVRQRQPA